MLKIREMAKNTATIPTDRNRKPNALKYSALVWLGWHQLLVAVPQPSQPDLAKSWGRLGKSWDKVGIKLGCISVVNYLIIN